MSVYTFTDEFDTVYLPLEVLWLLHSLFSSLPVLLKFLLVLLLCLIKCRCFSGFHLLLPTSFFLSPSSIYSKNVSYLVNVSRSQIFTFSPELCSDLQTFSLPDGHLHLGKGNSRSFVPVLNSLSFLPILVLIFFILTGSSSGHLFQFLINFHL